MTDERRSQSSAPGGESPKRADDPIEEAMDESFPASDPPAWTAARAGGPEGADDRTARRPDEGSPGMGCEAMALFDDERRAHAAADALLRAGFNTVDLSPRRDLVASARAVAPSSWQLSAVVGGLAGALAAMLLAPKWRAPLVSAAAAGAIGAVAGHAFSPAPAHPNMLVRVRVNAPDEERRALEIFAGHGACMWHAWSSPAG